MNTAPTTENENSTIDPAAAAFEAVASGVVVIGTDLTVISSNTMIKELVRLNGDQPAAGNTCHQMLFGRAQPCTDCPVQAKQSFENSEKSQIIKTTSNIEHYFRETFTNWGDRVVISLQDVTREVALLRKIDLAHKEVRAKNVLLERKRRQALDEQGHLTQLLDHLPDGLISVGTNLEIRRRNQVANEILPNPRPDASTCYEMIGYDTPCDQCPLLNGLSADMAQKNHQSAGRFINERIITDPAGKGGGLLFFRDITRKIELIKKIREQQDTIQRKNKILSGLVDLEAQMQKASEPLEVFNFFLDTFLPVLNVTAAALLINDIRAGNVWFTVQRHVTKAQMNELVCAYLSREVQSDLNAKVSQDAVPWQETTQVTLVGGHGQRVGLLILAIADCKHDDDLIQLFSDPLGAFIHNRLLMRQLEERANTDPLTGLYNRGYLELALAQEAQKLTRYGIHHAVVMIDVNRLKMVNDQYGHEAGDRMISMVGDNLKDNIRTTDIVARAGGDEFIVLLTNTTRQNAEQFIKRLRKTVFNELDLDVGANEKFPVRVSLGAAATDEIPPDQLIKKADQRMYAAKQAYYETNQRYR